MSEQNRIEEVKKILDKAYGFAPITQMGEVPQRVFLSNTDGIARQICQLFPQPLTDEELREKALLTDEEIEDATNSLPTYAVADTPGHVGHGVYRDERDVMRAIAKAATDKALPLLQPKIEQERERIANWLTRKVYADGLLIPHSIIQALKKGGEVNNLEGGTNVY